MPDSLGSLTGNILSFSTGYFLGSRQDSQNCNEDEDRMDVDVPGQKRRSKRKRTKSRSRKRYKKR